MKAIIHCIVFATCFIGLSVAIASGYPEKFHPGNYMLVFADGKKGSKPFEVIKAQPEILGIQKRYLWNDLESAKDEYDFSQIESDLKYLQSIGKRLVIQFEDVGIGREHAVPEYLLSKEYGGGDYKGTGPHSKFYVAMRWNKLVAEREAALLKALGAKFDKEPFVEALVLDETATGIVPRDYIEAGYSPEKMRDGVMTIMSAAKEAFPNTVVIQYINYLTGNNQYLEDITRHAYKIGVGFGGPDVVVGKDIPSYKYYKEYAGKIPLGSAVQFFNYQAKRADGSEVSVADIRDFAENTLHLDYIFWLPRAGYYKTEVLPMLEQQSKFK